MPADPDSITLPEPPPPRPVARDAAIEAALRRFDGAESTTKASAPRMGWNRNPAWGLAIAASLVAVIGLPAAFIALRDQGSHPISEPAPARSAEQPRRAVPAQLTPQAAPSAPTEDRAIPIPPGAPPARLQRHDIEIPAPAIAPMAAAPAPPESGMLAAAPPPPAPPPPPPPAPMAQKSASESREIAVTGSRIRQGSSSNEASDALNDLPAMQAPKAPDRVQKDRAYAVFLSHLQTAIRTNNRDAVIKLIGFPLRVNFDGGSRTYRNARSVRADFDRIFTPPVRNAIVAQRLDRLFGRDQGIMIGSGEIWFDHVCLDRNCDRVGPVRITAVNP